MAIIDVSEIKNVSQVPDVYLYKIDNESPYNKIPLIVFNYNGNINAGDYFSSSFKLDTSYFNYIADVAYTAASSLKGEDQFGQITVDNDVIKISYDSTIGVYLKLVNSNTTTGSFKMSTSTSVGIAGGFTVVLIKGLNNAALLTVQGTYIHSSSVSSPDPVSLNKKGSPFNIGDNSSTISLGYVLGGSITAAQIADANALLNQATIYDPDDPFNGADDSSPNGGDGNMDYDSDDDDFPDMPTNTVSDSGFVTLYAPTAAQLKSLANYLWSDTFSLDSFKKLFNNPMDCILGLSLVPVNLPHGTAKEITVGNLVSTVSCDTCTTQYVYVDCGSIEVSPESFTNSYLDFSPYTQIMLYLPYIGTQPLDTDEVMGSTIHVRYHIDVLTGAMCCFVKITNKNPISGSSATHVLYTYMGQCCESVPLSSDQWGNTIGAIMQAAAAIGGVVATAASGGAAAPAAAATLTTATTATVNAATSMKPTVNHSGSLGGGGGMMAQRTPKLIMKAPYISKPSKQQNYTGYPVNQTKKLSACSGFTQVQNINLVISAEGVGATQAELTEIENLLISGVYI